MNNFKEGPVYHRALTDNSVRQYAYENSSFPSALTGVTDESGCRRLTWRYDAQGRPNHGHYGSGNGAVDAVYNGNQVTTTDARGTQRTRRFASMAGRPVMTSLATAATSDSAAAVGHRQPWGDNELHLKTSCNVANAHGRLATTAGRGWHLSRSHHDFLCLRCLGAFEQTNCFRPELTLVQLRQRLLAGKAIYR